LSPDSSNPDGGVNKALVVKLEPDTVKFCDALAVPVVLEKALKELVLVDSEGEVDVTVPLSPTTLVVAPVEDNVILPVTVPVADEDVIRVYIVTGCPTNVPPLCPKVVELTKVELSVDIS
jgi:hypothetical protein